MKIYNNLYKNNIKINLYIIDHISLIELNSYNAKNY